MQKSAQSYVNEIGLTVTVERPINAGELRTGNDQTEWIITVPVEPGYSLNLRYE